jgi:tRNA A37 methylthiotransferase MiaB
MAVQRKVVRERARTLKGAEDTALLLRRDGDAWVGRLRRQAPEVDGETRVAGAPADAKPGDFLEVRICGGKTYDLEAKVV